MRHAALVLGFILAASATAAQQTVTAGTGAVLRALEKVNGEITDFELARGASQEIGRMSITLRACRYPPDNPAGEAYAYLTITENVAEQPEFDGWMIASSPALNALEHPRYDVWVLRCKTE